MRVGKESEKLHGIASDASKDIPYVDRIQVNQVCVSSEGVGWPCDVLTFLLGAKQLWDCEWLDSAQGWRRLMNRRTEFGLLFKDPEAHACCYWANDSGVSFGIGSAVWNAVGPVNPCFRVQNEEVSRGGAYSVWYAFFLHGREHVDASA